ncbi:histidine kinase [Pseudokineococcus basanitobsidens]|uniref:histidine kinase n=1 Tax=Pseudokineococcus basanitobsidens TaxID=1926649 RepID=A0ABU8RGD2_9ACTN
MTSTAAPAAGASPAGAAPPPAGAPRPPAPGPRYPRLRSAAVSLVCSLLGPLVFLVVLGSSLEQGGAPQRLPLWALLLVVDVAVGVAAGVLAGLLPRSRTLPLVLVVAGVVSTWAAPAGVVGVVRAGARRSPALDGLVLAVVVGGGVGYERLLGLAGPPTQDRLPLWVEVVAFTALAALLLLWGRARGTRAALVASLHAQAGAAERERAALARSRAADVARTRAEERSAIARDMHDTLSHQLSLIAVHAGALAARDDLPPERAREAARTVRDAAADANAVLREVLTALRSTDPAQRLGHHGGALPLPTAASLDALVERARAQGQPVDLVRVGASARDLDERSPTTAASVVQITTELLVNAGKHAPGAPVEVRLAHEGDELLLRASNPLAAGAPPALGTGLGLVGVAERARLLGGGMRHATTPDGRFVVEVTVPWQV